MNLIAIETSTPYCSLAVCRGERIFSRHIEAAQRHAEMALEELQALLREAGMQLADFQGIAFGEGPGAFTGLRIACGMTQGLALARNWPVLGVGTLLAVAEESGADKVIACLDARMGEVYHAAYQRQADEWQEVCVPRLCAPDAVPAVEGSGWSACGSGFAAHGEVLQLRLAAHLSEVKAGIFPTATAILRLARPRFARGEGKPAAQALPLYLRDKVALTTLERQ